MNSIVDVLVIVYNRPEFTVATLETLLADSPPFRVWIWQNGTHSAVSSIVDKFAHHELVSRVHRSSENKGLRDPTNWLWQESQARYFAKVDDDCLMPAGWCDRLLDVHEAVSDAGILGSWPFREEDIRQDLVEKKMRDFNEYRIMVNPWVGGSGYVMRSECVARCGLLGKNEGFTNYCMRVAKAGWVNGWPLPMLVMDHMDDPRSEYTVFKSDADVLKHRGITAEKRGICTLSDLTARVEHAALELQTCSSDWRDYIGWSAKAKRVLRRFTG